MIVVGIDNGLANRINEYTYDADRERGGGHGAEYAGFLLTEVKPFVDQRYRTQLGRTHTFLGGSSLGALVSLEIARRHPDIFGGVIAMSPALWWAGQSVTQSIERDAGGLVDARVWIDIGSREGSSRSAAGPADPKNQLLTDAAHRLDEALAKHRIDHHLMIDDAEHNEQAWAKRFPQAIVYITGAKN
jgi:predicted alpha/beta superfamily hydrolase